MGSVKDIVTNSNDPVYTKHHRDLGPHHFGQDAFRTSGRHSVLDLKALIPPVEIPNKAEILTMQVALYLEQAGAPTTYLGVIGPDNELTSARKLLDEGKLSDTVVMRTANVPETENGKVTERTRREFHQAIEDGDISVYVADVESIFRAGFPLGSSVFKRIFGAMGEADLYSKLATYPETEQAILKLRERVDRDGMPHDLEKLLAKNGLDHIPLPGETLEHPVIGYTTKFDPAGDKHVTDEEARGLMHLSSESYAAWNSLVKADALRQIKYSAGQGITNGDGKTEAAVKSGTAIFTDFACSVDENRLMVEFTQDGVTYLIPTNKEIMRGEYRAHGVEQAITEAKKQHGDAWQEHLVKDGYITKQNLTEAAHAAVELMSKAIKTVGNMTLGKTVFDAPPIEKWVGEFLPYASRVQERATR